MVEGEGMRGGVDGDDAPLDGKSALGGGRLWRLASEEAEQKHGGKKNT
jgi:hypothetical protein